MTKYITTTDTAKIIRKILKKYHPDIKFSVRSKSYSGGSSITINWTDGPTERQIKRITEYFEGASFDGMIDLKSYQSKIELDEKGEEVKVHYGPDYIFTSRQFSKNFVQKVAEIVIKDFNLKSDLLRNIKESYDGTYYWDVNNITPEGLPEDLGIYFHRYASKIEGNPDGSIKKHRVKASYLKKLAAIAYSQSDDTIFTEKLEEEYNIPYKNAWNLFLQYSKQFKF